MNRKLPITIKVVITALLGIIGIVYILNKSPVSEVDNYQKQDMPKPYKYKAKQGFFSNKPSSSIDANNGDNDDISLMGKSGRYDDVRIGKAVDE
ncbi:MAG: hypothetical protein OQL06_00515 [Gammaproteobacteria bacterium]|nr:hypothetical protein [Gammaproteobacteria bacterium]